MGQRVPPSPLNPAGVRELERRLARTRWMARAVVAAGWVGAAALVVARCGR